MSDYLDSEVISIPEYVPGGKVTFLGSRLIKDRRLRFLKIRKGLTRLTEQSVVDKFTQELDSLEIVDISGLPKEQTSSSFSKESSNTPIVPGEDYALDLRGISSVHNDAIYPMFRLTKNLANKRGVYLVVFDLNEGSQRLLKMMNGLDYFDMHGERKDDDGHTFYGTVGGYLYEKRRPIAPDMLIRP